MKSALTLLAMVIIFTSCGKDNNCKNRETMRVECQARHIPNYGYQYAVEMCDRSYSSDRCY